jgi:hypothetical protein
MLRGRVRYVVQRYDVVRCDWSYGMFSEACIEPSFLSNANLAKGFLLIRLIKLCFFVNQVP